MSEKATKKSYCPSSDFRPTIGGLLKAKWQQD